jgi:hypothetical protein
MLNDDLDVKKPFGAKSSTLKRFFLMSLQAIPRAKCNASLDEKILAEDMTHEIVGFSLFTFINLSREN